MFALYKDVAIEQENVEIIRRMPTRVDGGLRVESVAYKDGAEEKALAVDGVFIIKDTVSVTKLVQGLEYKKGGIVVDDKMQTNIPGIFAAGVPGRRE